MPDISISQETALRRAIERRFGQSANGYRFSRRNSEFTITDEESGSWVRGTFSESGRLTVRSTHDAAFPVEPASPAAPVASDPVPADVPCYMAVSTDAAGVETVMGVFRVAEHASAAEAEREARKLCEGIQSAARGADCDVIRTKSTAPEVALDLRAAGYRETPIGGMYRKPGARDALIVEAGSQFRRKHVGPVREDAPAMVPQVAQQQQANAGGCEPEAEAAREMCETCQGNGEIVTDWSAYLGDGQPASDAVAECPDCDGIGTRAMVPQPAQQQQSNAVPSGQVYSVRVRRIVREDTVIEVQAESEDEAMQQAEIKSTCVDDEAWDVYDCEYSSEVEESAPAMVPQTCQPQQARAAGSELPPGYSLEEDSDGDWVLIPPAGVTIFSVPGEPLLIGACDRATALSDAIEHLQGIDVFGN